MVVADGTGLPIGCDVRDANRFESTLTEAALDTVRVPRNGPGRPKTNPKRLIADRAYDANQLRENLARRGIDLIAPDERPKSKTGGSSDATNADGKSNACSPGSTVGAA